MTAESPHNTAQRRNLYGRISCVSYAGFALGLGCLSRTNFTVRIGGAILCLATTALFVYMRRTITKMFVHFCATARKTDMENITHSYEIPISVDGVQTPSEQGPAGFWVAVIESPENKTSEVVGYLGLDYRANSDPSSGELRRMIVSMHHRRRRIGSLLITAAMDHARRHSPPLQTLDLETTEFQPGALKLYEGHGYSLVGTRMMRMGPLFSMTVFRLRRRVMD
ncbi:acyl-CoA N-acyltransferase [Mycena capillaripes]|nr:acyl-CoA N-acyltransferase [Mycena capillaripes]